ncbi:diaminopimelate decarboxylase [Ruminococcaceae bacterium R-25]|nr:diaminopimelate decarboxylase [Ruminococcaceae bacterium R-25]SUQ11335.1 diaminopimelate decarboxylase [Oscillospiraceae bacterium]
MKKQLTTEILNNLSERYGNAFYLLESDSFKNNYKELSQAFKKYYSKFNIAYSYKTNYTPKLVQIVDQLDGYAEVVSEMEMEIALKAGVNPSHIIWNGPVKNDDKVKDLLLAGGTVNIDSVYEIDNIRAIAESNPNTILTVGVRCNYDVGDGVVSRFGFDVNSDDFDTVLTFIKESPNIRLVNLQAHFAKRSPEFWTKRAEGMIKIYDSVVEKYGLKPERLDIGGGIYGKMPDSLRNQLGIVQISYDDYATRAAKVFAEHFKDASDAPYLFIEPGSALAGDCMRFVGRIETIKEVRGKTIATVYGSQKNISMSGINPPMDIIAGGEIQKDYKDLDIVGYTCIEGDVLQKNFCGKLAVGDFIVIENCGSYSLVMKPPFILPNFPVLDICGDSVEMIKRAETFEDLFRTFSFNKWCNS